MWTSLRRVPAFLLTSILLTGLACADDDGGRGPSARGPIFDITHFDVLPVNLGMPDSFEQTAYTALFLRIVMPAYRIPAPRAFGSSIGFWLRTIRKSSTSGAASTLSRHI